MEEVALADINNFASAPFPTTAADILNQILEHQQDLERRVSELEEESHSKDATIEQLKAENRALRIDLTETDRSADTARLLAQFMDGKIDHLDKFVTAQTEAFREGLAAHVENVALERAYDRKRITALEENEDGPTEKLTCGKTMKNRIHDVKELLKTNHGRMPFKEIRKRMDLTYSQMSQLIDRLDKRHFRVINHPRNHKEKILELIQRAG